MFAAFGGDQLTPINTSSPSAEIAKWKVSSEVRDCYKKLLTPHNNYMERVLDKMLGLDRDKRHKVQVAFTLALVEHMLSPGRDIKINEELMQIKIEVYMVCFCNYNSYILYYMLCIMFDKNFPCFRVNWTMSIIHTIFQMNMKAMHQIP